MGGRNKGLSEGSVRGMGDLIRRSELMESLIKCKGLGRNSCGLVADMVRNQPAAYDVGKVVDDLKDHAIEFEAFGQCSDYVELSHAIEIVRGGGVGDA